MTISRDDQAALDAKENLDDDAQLAIDGATVGVLRELQSRGYKAKGGDRLAAVEAAIVRYFIASQGAA